MTENLPPDPPQPSRGDPADPPAPPTAETARMSSGDPLGGPERPASAPPPPPPPPPPKRRFLRSRDDRVLGGVAGGLGAHLNVDASLLRLAFVVLALFGGAGVLLYLAAWLIVPDAPAGAQAAGPDADRNKALTVLGVVALVVIAGPLLFVPALFAGGLLVPLVFLAGVGLLAAWLVTGRRPGRDARSLLVATGIGLAVLAGLGLLAVAAFWAAGLGGDTVVAAIVIAAGVALLAGAVSRPVRWLILPAVAVAIPAGFVAAAGIDLDGGFGDKTYRPATAADVRELYEVGAGELTVDLRRTDLPPGDVRLRMEVGMGAATLIVPEDVCVATDAEVGVGAVEFFDDDSAGVDVAVAVGNTAPRGTTRLLLDADVGFGLAEVRHTEPWGDRFDRDWDDEWDEDRDEDRSGFGPPAPAPPGTPGHDGRFDPDDQPGNEACSGAAN